MTDFVLDCSITMPWCFEDEISPHSEAALDALASVAALVPSIWPVEVANVLAVTERRGRVSESRIAYFLKRLEGLPIRIDTQTARRALSEVLTLARTHGLTAYDAAYLELAMRQGVPLCTLDTDLQRACAVVGVELFRG
jgi:predicted nucleic acid-binding protein